jgi:hypothetical protein
MSRATDGMSAPYLNRMEGAMCDTHWSSRRKELECLEKSWREFEELVQWLRQRGSRQKAPDPAVPVPEAVPKPQPANG